MNRPDYETLDRIANGYRGAAVLFAALRLGLFAVLNRCALTASALARRRRTDRRATRILCDALAALGLLEKRGDRYRNSALAREFLVPHAPRSQAALLLHNADLYERWSRLAETVRTGRPPPRHRDARRFARAMASSAALGAREAAAAVDLSEVRTMLDVGGGPGLYALEFARRQPRLHAVVFDNAPTLEVAREHIERAGLGTRVTVQAGDAFRDDLGGPYDFILLSNIVHVYSAAENRRLMARAARALAPGGRVGVKDFVLEAGRTRPVKASLFAVNMLLNTEGGDCYTAAEIRQWLRAAGLQPAGVVPLTPPSQLVLGRRPASW